MGWADEFRQFWAGPHRDDDRLTEEITIERDSMHHNDHQLLRNQTEFRPGRRDADDNLERVNSERREREKELLEQRTNVRLDSLDLPMTNEQRQAVYEKILERNNKEYATLREHIGSIGDHARAAEEQWNRGHPDRPFDDTPYREAMKDDLNRCEYLTQERHALDYRKKELEADHGHEM